MQPAAIVLTMIWLMISTAYREDKTKNQITTENTNTAADTVK